MVKCNLCLDAGAGERACVRGSLPCFALEQARSRSLCPEHGDSKEATGFTTTQVPVQHHVRQSELNSFEVNAPAINGRATSLLWGS